MNLSTKTWRCTSCTRSAGSGTPIGGELRSLPKTTGVVSGAPFLSKPEAAAAAGIGAGLGGRKRYELLELLHPCFARVEPWLQAGKYAAAPMSDLLRRNGLT
jgi:hypothetical protein